MRLIVSELPSGYQKLPGE
jgi:hypothetical protein